MKTIILLSVTLLMAACGTSSSQERMNVTKFQKEIASHPDGVVLDVRTPEEVAKGHLKGAVNIDYKSSAFETSLASLDKSKTYYVYCAAGVRSDKAAAVMKEKGFKNVYTLEGGIQAWTAAGQEVVKN